MSIHTCACVSMLLFVSLFAALFLCLCVCFYVCMALSLSLSLSSELCIQICLCSTPSRPPSTKVAGSITRNTRHFAQSCTHTKTIKGKGFNPRGGEGPPHWYHPRLAWQVVCLAAFSSWGSPPCVGPFCWPAARTASSV